MQAVAEDTSLPGDIDAQPVVRAAAALRPMLRHYHDQIEREQRFPPELVAQLHAAGFYRLLLPRALGGLQADPLTYIRVVELLAEGLGSVGWNIANNGVAQLVTLALPDAGVRDLYGEGHRTVVAGTAIQGGGQAIPVEGGYRVTGRWTFGSGCQEAVWMLGSFQILDDGEPRRRADGGMFWRGMFPRAEVEVIPGSWDVTGLRGTGSFDWTVRDYFLPERRTTIHAGVPVDNQWSHWPGITYALPVQAWVGPHQCAVITGIARAGIDALIALAGEKAPRGRTGMLCDNPQVQDAIGRADAILESGRIYRDAMIAELWATVAAGQETTRQQRARCRLAAVHAADSARQAMDLMYRHGGSTSFKSDSRLAECWRDLQVVGRPPPWRRSGTRSAAGSTWASIRARACGSRGRRPVTGRPKGLLIWRAGMTTPRNAMAAGQQIILRLTIADPVPGVAYSLQNKKSEPVGMVVAGDRPLSFDVPVAVAPGPRFLGEFVRREGPARRFVYIAIGGQAGDAASPWSRRAKIDIQDLPADLLEKALAGKVVEIVLPGRAKDGTPACATLPALGSWRLAK